MQKRERNSLSTTYFTYKKSQITSNMHQVLRIYFHRFILILWGSMYKEGETYVEGTGKIGCRRRKGGEKEVEKVSECIGVGVSIDVLWVGQE